MILMIAGAFYSVHSIVFPNSHQQLSRRASKALSREEWSLANKLASSALSADPDNSHLIAIAGIANARMHEIEKSVEHLERLSESSNPQALLELGMRYLGVGRLMDAELSMKRAIKFDPEFLDAHRELGLLLSFEGRCEEASPHILREIQSGHFRSDQLCLLGIPERIVRRDESQEAICRTYSADDPLYQLGQARVLLADHQLAAADAIAQKIVARYPNLALAQSLLGKIYLEQAQQEKLLSWHRSLPDSVTDAPEIWYVRSQWARQSNQTESTIRCLLEVLKTRPDHIEANYQLSQAFKKVAEDAPAKYFSERSLLLSRLAYVINDLRGDPNTRLMKQAVEALEKLGRNWEAIGWCQMAKQWDPADWVTPTFARLRSIVTRDSSRRVADYNPLNGINIADYPLPKWEDKQPSKERPIPGSYENTTNIRFSDTSTEVGLNFEYFNSMDTKVGLEHIFQTTGGGAAAIDFDLDLWPDLYFGNGRVLPETAAGLLEPQSQHQNAMYRNRRGIDFERVDALAMIPDGGFGQGVASGDFNNDGFPDIYTGNVGGNCLYQNNGDGTFTEISQQTGTDGNEWTMSAMIADVDGDGLSDIYAVNYLKIDEVFERSCKRNDQPLTCAPTLFTAEQDRLYRNLGNGDFEDVTESWGIVHPNGKGLGIVGFSVEGRKGLQLFVANDTTENLYFQTGPDHPHYQESAVLAGLAMNDTGTMQACMGVAAGDANLDGSVDLFITNFIADSNTMYTQLSPGVFTDMTRSSRLAEPSYAMVGFGTQFLDADLDGREDLIVTNGHVDQTFATGEPDRMPPQFFHNIGDGQFAQLSAESLGDLFQQQRFGRSLVRIDWNRDQKDDACIVHLDDSVALATNMTSTDNRSLVVRLKGVASARDAVGSQVTFVTTQNSYSHQLTGGDGYQASNERKVSFGIPNGEDPVSLRIQWPNGKIEESRVSGGHFVAIQGSGLFEISSRE